MEKEAKSTRTEEIRALFVLGFLAVLASVRNQAISVVVGQSTISLNQIIDTTILLMSLYAVFMIFGFSKDMIGESTAAIFKSLALLVLLLNFVILTFFGILYGVSYFQSRLVWLLGITALPIAYAFILKFNEIRKKRSKDKRKKIRFIDIVKLISVSGFVICFLWVGYYSPEEHIWIFFVGGFTSMAVMIFLDYKIKKDKLRLENDSKKETP